MSLYKNYYIIAGYDLAPYKTDKYEDWKWTDEGEQYLCRHSKGNIQIFDDPCNGEHFYLGYILAHGDQYEFKTTVIDLLDINISMVNAVRATLKTLYDIGVVDECNSEVKILVFEEVV